MAQALAALDKGYHLVLEKKTHFAAGRMPCTAKKKKA